MALCAVKGISVFAVENSVGNGLHFLYVRRHDVRNKESELPTDKTIFVANVPFIYTEKSLRQAFSSFGKVREVKFTSRAQQKKLDLIF